jgi:FG-GAP-like repeat/Galactose oxidase, central domain
MSHRMLANATTSEMALLNINDLSWTPTGTGKADINDEEGWTLLPDGTVLTVDANLCNNSERYDPSTGAWSSAGSTIVQLPDCTGNQSIELGPQVLRPDGTVVVFGGTTTGTTHTAIFNSSTNTWTQGPDLPSVCGGRVNANFTTMGAIYDPVADTWTAVAPPSGWTKIGDAQSIVLANGTYTAFTATDRVLWLNVRAKNVWPVAVTTSFQAAAATETGASTLYVIANGIASAGTAIMVAASCPNTTATHDFNGDGESDIAWRDGNGDTAIWLMNGTTVLSSGGVGTVPAAWSIVGQRDFNGDGKYDLLWRDTSGNTAMWFLNGTQVATSAGIGNIPTNWTVAVTGDFDGDGFGATTTGMGRATCCGVTISAKRASGS